jgi:catechol 2,3-dioxygenase-like lactoylglutathione lyase family enzyme
MQAMISVDQLDQSLAFYRDLLKFQVILEGDVQGPSIEKLWLLPKGTTGHVAVLEKPGTRWGRVRLVKFSPKSRTIIRLNATNWDQGIVDIAFLGEDAFKNKELFGQKGFFTSDIAYYKIPAYEEMFLRELMVKAPDWVNIVFLHYDPPYKLRGLKGFSEVLHSVIIVSDLEKSLWFYKELLEMDPQTDMTLNIVDHEPLFRILCKIPKESMIRRVRILSLRREKGFTGRIMLFQFLDESGNPVGVDYFPQTIPPHIGLCLLSFETDDIRKLESRLRRNKIEIICPPQAMGGDLFGNRTAMTVKAPEGTLLEFIESYRSN